MSVMLLDVWRAARARSVPFSGESAGYVALGLCEMMERDPRAIDLAAIELGTDGGLRVARGEPCSGERTEGIVRDMLGKLLGVASSPGPALFRAANREPGAGVDGLATELKKALIPVNRAAARRALLRLCRETERAVAAGRLAPEEDLNALVVNALVESSAPRVASPPPLPVRTSAPRVPSPPPLPVEPSPPRVVTPPPLPLESSAPRVASLPVLVAPVAVAPVPVAPVAVAPPAQLVTLLAEPQVELEPEHLTSAETVVARVKQRARSIPPPLPVGDRHSSTPRIGTIESSSVVPPSSGVAPSNGVAKVTRTPSPPPLPVWPEQTERAPQVREYAGEPFELCASVIDAVPVVELVAEPRVIPNTAIHVAPPPPQEDEPAPLEEEAQEVAPELAAAPLEPARDADAEERAIQVALAINAESSESSELEESPALVVGVHVEDSEEVAEPVDDDDIETRPLLGRLPPLPYVGLPLRQSSVPELLNGFQVGAGIDETELRRELKALAGVDLTPAQVSAVRPR